MVKDLQGSGESAGAIDSSNIGFKVITLLFLSLFVCVFYDFF